MDVDDCLNIKCERLIQKIKTTATIMELFNISTLPLFEFKCNITGENPEDNECPLNLEPYDLDKGDFLLIESIESEYGDYCTVNYLKSEKSDVIEAFNECETAALLVVIRRKGQKEFPEV